jgi:hypothetical protein
MKILFFKPQSAYYPFRWFIVFVFALTSLLMYANLTGWRLLGASNQQQWTARSPGYHK